MGTAFWIGLGVAAWLALALVVALSIGRMIRERDQQVPRLEPRVTRRRDPSHARGAVAHTKRYLHGRS
jgi:hypothetical protein